MINAKSIKQKKGTEDVLDLPFLQLLGTEFIQKLSGQVWTDYNVHDPGVTLLEILAYAITDLGYRTRNRVPAILAAPSKDKMPKHTLFGPKEILHNSPVTVRDYAKLFLTIDGVKNAQMVPSVRNPDFKGIYDLLLEVEVGADTHKIKRHARALYLNNRHHHKALAATNLAATAPERDGQELLYAHRNLCEELDEIHFRAHSKIKFEISLELKPGTYVNRFLEDLVILLREFLSPQVVHHQVQDLLRKGYPVEQIFNGPALPYGCILDSEMAALTQKQEIRSSDLVMLLMQLGSVLNIRDLVMIDRYNARHKWVCPIEANTSPILDLAGSWVKIYNDNDGLVHSSDLQNKRAATGDLQALKTTHKMDLVVAPPAPFLNLQDYYSIQNEFPRVYGVGEAGLRHDETAKRKGQAKQFKGYLMFFDQVLANYLAQLANLNKLFSLEAIDQSSYFQPLLDVPHGETLYHPFVMRYLELHIEFGDAQRMQADWQDFKRCYNAWIEFWKTHDAPRANESKLKKVWDEFANTQTSPYLQVVGFIDSKLYAAIETAPAFWDRRNRLLDHLLARFAIDTKAYEFTQPGNPKKQRDIATKLRVLEAVPRLSRSRGVGLMIEEGPSDPQTNATGLAPADFSGIEQTLINLFSVSQTRRDHINSLGDDIFGVAPTTSSSATMGENASSDEIVLENCLNESDAVQRLFRYGLQGQRYALSRGRKSLEIKDDNDEIVARFLLEKPIPSKSKSEVIQLKIDQLAQAGTRFECLHVVEHLLLRPEKEAYFFGFEIYDLSGERLLFQTENFKPFRKREKILLELLNAGCDPAQYKVVFLMQNQYRLYIQVGHETLYGPEIYTSANEVDQMIEIYAKAFQALYVQHVSTEIQAANDFRLEESIDIARVSAEHRAIAYFEAATDRNSYSNIPLGPSQPGATDQRSQVMIQKSIRIDNQDHLFKFESRRVIQAPVGSSVDRTFDDFVHNNIQRLQAQFLNNVYQNPCIKFITRNSELYREVSDPYSHIVTVVFPAWPPRFQNEIFKAWAKRMAQAELPAHLAVNFRWLPYTEMLAFETEFVALLQQKKTLRKLETELEVLEKRSTEKFVAEADAAAHSAALAACRSQIRALRLDVSDKGEEILQLPTASKY